MKIIINNMSKYKDEEILLNVIEVIKMGRVSNKGKSYCYGIDFNYPYPVTVYSKLNKQSDTFDVLDKRQEDK